MKKPKKYHRQLLDKDMIEAELAQQQTQEGRHELSEVEVYLVKQHLAMLKSLEAVPRVPSLNPSPEQGMTEP